MVKYSRDEKYTKPKDIKDLLILAREKEKGAVGFYNDMLKQSFALKFVGDLIAELRDMELGHVKMIEAKMQELGL